MIEGNPNCTACRLHIDVDEVCEMGFGNEDADIMVVSKFSNSDGYHQLICDALVGVGIDIDRCYFTQALRCKNFEINSGSAGQIKACKPYLQKEIDHVRPRWILAFGNEALKATTGHSGITSYRAKPLAGSGATVIATISPAAVNRNPGQKASWLSDIRFFASQVLGMEAKVKKPKVALIDTKKKFNQLKKVLDDAELLSYDIETNGFDEFREDAAIVSLAGTVVKSSGDTLCWALPLYHPESPFRKNWKRALELLAPHLTAPRKQVAHNGKFDARWLRQFGVPATVTFDTLLAVHLLNENELKGLKSQATSRFGVESWDVDTKNLLAEPLRPTLVYNALDTWYTYHIYQEARAELLERERLLRVFRLILTPVNNELISIERRGIWIDKPKLRQATKICIDMRDEIEREIAQFIPEITDERWPTTKKGKKRELNFNASIWLRWFLFEYLGMPVINRGKEKDDGSPGDPSVAEEVMLELQGLHPVIQLLLDRVKWQKYASAFLPAYEEMADENDRIHTTYKLAGTVTGRLSSGKEDDEKVTGKVPNRGVNIQQVPRDPLIRGLFGAAPGFTFVEIDFSQVELRVVAHLARERTMLHLYNTGQDIHRATAAWVLGVPADKVNKDDRKKAKAVNFGFVYGMGAKRFVHTAFTKYGVTFTLEEAQDVRDTFFRQFKGLPAWHARMRRVVKEKGYVQSPLGRVRHLPDIHSEDWKVRGEAERQAINSPVQAFASDMNLLAMLQIIRVWKKEGVEGYALGTVHDATLLEVRTEQLARALPLLKDTYEHLPLKKQFGVELTVPIVADIKVGTHWGEAIELTSEQVYNFDPSILPSF